MAPEHLTTHSSVTEAPKGTEIISDRDYLAAIAAEINDRPRKIYDWKKT